MPPKTPRFITPSSTEREPSKQPVNSQQPPRQPRFTQAAPSSTPASRSTPKFISAASTSASQKRPLFHPPPSTPTPASRLAFAAPTSTTPNETIDSDIVADSSPIATRKRRWEYEDDDPNSSPPPQDSDMMPPSSPPDLPSPTLSRTLRILPFTPIPTKDPATTGSSVVGAPPLFRPSAATDSHLLPVDWSPTKKRGSGKYVPDGLAATVVGWVLETRHAQGRKLGGEVVVGGVGVEEGFIAVTGGEEGLLLVRGQAKGVVGVGCRVAYEWPWWEVEVQGRVWRMCVFWSVVDGVVEGDDEMLF